MSELAPTINLRPLTDNDLAFLFTLYASTRANEMAVVNWSESEKQSFLKMQFDAQDTYYRQQFKRASFQVIYDDSQPIGRLYVDRREQEIRVIDIALMSDYRNRGIGKNLMQQLIAEADAANQPLTIHVEHNNPAMSLYKRLGFEHIQDEGVYYLMEWSNHSKNTQAN